MSNYYALSWEVICQFPHVSDKQKELGQGQQLFDILQEIADSGGLGISNPVTWQREVRQDRALPFRSD